MPPLQKRIEQLSFWILYLWGQLYFIRDGGAYLLDGKVIGYSWYNYLRQAWLIERRIGRHYNYFREPLYGGIVAEFGELTGSYANMAILVSSLAGSLAALVLGRLVWQSVPKNGGFWGGFASLSMFLIAGNLPIGRWGNHYTLLVFATILVFWQLFRSIQTSGGWGWLALSLGFAASVDQRLAPWLMVAIGFSVFFSKNWKWRVLNPILLGIGGMGCPRFLRWYFEEEVRHRLSTAEILEFQRDVVSRWALGDVNSRTKACDPVPMEDYLQVGFIGTDCSWEIMKFNWLKDIPSFTLFPVHWIFVALGLLLIVVLLQRSAVRFGHWLLLTGIVGSVVFWSLIMPLPTRYLPSVCIGLSLVIPFTFAMIEPLNKPFLRWFLRLGMLGVALYYGYVAPEMFEIRKKERRQVDEQERYWRIWQIVDEYRADESFLDCAQMGFNSLILPERYVSMPFHQLRNSSFCQEWIENGSGTWVLVQMGSSLGQNIESLELWNHQYHFQEGNLSLWKYEGPKQ